VSPRFDIVALSRAGCLSSLEARMGMTHHERDGRAAVARARASYRTTWHPIQSAVEVVPGEWWMVTQYGDRYAIIRMLEIGGERGYRAVTGDDDPEERQLIGYFRRLRAACEKAHKHWLGTQARAGGVNGR
jgi:hypothetical protein